MNCRRARVGRPSVLAILATVSASRGVSTGADQAHYSGGKLYGFVDLGANSGAIVAIDPTTGATTPVENGSIEWFGAGVTTDAPIIN